VPDRRRWIAIGAAVGAAIGAGLQNRRGG